ncbi:MAG TPA: aminotransferase class V-fold PLP-dependent enzyme [Candidatus Hydrogenedentes bacterium]|nr:aminotransferase class V-fold PLP-dependent enzyme [Candidatus Hydrogenedentota bacterium]HOL78152.1 aminotransferase class V-fold PLP-dependent enzyme [Candidatus Hydrogenedentota bacterium]HPO87239.1 aminotransferase class V-fold PLP-dependent enzyme [Candidatus Hydrogenedentota bacterium]
MMTISSLLAEPVRNQEFPVTTKTIFLAHAAVTALPHVVVKAMEEFLRQASLGSQEDPVIWEIVQKTRETAARLLGCHADEIALLGPTSIGLNLVAQGLPWKPGDAVIFYGDDYPSNVYPWRALQQRGVTLIPLQPEHPGVITWEHIESMLTPSTRLVALASCHFLSGYRIDIDTIGRNLHERGILFCLDGIQSLGAFPVSVDHVDFLSADSHKWLLGPCGAGIFYVRRSCQDILTPTLLGSWNVVSPGFIAQDKFAYYPGARRYEPGTLNLPGIVGMHAAMELLLTLGVEVIANRILHLRRFFVEGLRSLGYRLYLEEFDTRPQASDKERSGIISVESRGRDIQELATRLETHGVAFSLRRSRSGKEFLRFSPHFYNTEEELQRVLDLMKT